VDNESDALELATFVLEQAQATVISAASVDEAMAMLPRSQADVLVSDIGMPEQDGYMLMQQVRSLPLEQGGQIPAIALTAYAGNADCQRAIAAGFQRHLSKPFDPQVLLSMVADLVKQKQNHKHSTTN
jgi:CheY-like chemotaxis protein